MAAASHVVGPTLLRPFARRNYDYFVRRALQWGWRRHDLLLMDASRPSIVAACEDYKNITEYTIAGKRFPLPQTSQMHMEWNVMSDGVDSDIPGYMHVTTSYRDEGRPVPMRHASVFKMFEFEKRAAPGADCAGAMAELNRTVRGFLNNFGVRDDMIDEVTYEDACNRLGVRAIGDREETLLTMAREDRPVVMLTYFPERSDPYWNMARLPDFPDIAYKIDTLGAGLEMIGAAVRGVDAMAMRARFNAVSGGKVAQRLYAIDQGKAEEELAETLRMVHENPVMRYGGGMGIWRVMFMLETLRLLPEREDWVHAEWDRKRESAAGLA